ncbi:hypothetical protein [Pseudobacteriovorax antillogorgiicola]|uniref:Uncharacterized protein n=1 Tax=Pseudobacteriovorax antillogorgiicola TaxID=1513793 RepID=A0A1Y6BBE4_9BACT|nr:hypothetical protein [Pseudobacteriovorax antillogorgiicola]TCS57406.1 hypothetical protein EDD56_103146 [Pseudobacteriovorax antillogorgiicola]SMF01543.1 hypothetical protein SAMN06296036_103187 [Pseudobacteriovorax antillogorgiicola]
MNVEELYPSRTLEEDELRRALAFTFHMLPEEVAVVEEFSGDEDFNVLKLVCQFEEIQGSYKMKLQIFGLNLKDQELFTDLVKKFAKHIKSECLIPDGDSLSPFDMIRITPEGELREVRLSVKAFENESFELEAG